MTPCRWEWYDMTGPLLMPSNCRLPNDLFTCLLLHVSVVVATCNIYFPLLTAKYMTIH